LKFTKQENVLCNRAITFWMSILTSLMSVCAFGQIENMNIDSMLNSESPYKIKIEALDKICEAKINTDLVKYSYSAKKGLDLALEYQDSANIILFNFYYSNTKRFKGQLDSALYYVRKCYQYVIYGDSQYQYPLILNKEADLLYTVGDYKKSGEVYGKAIRVSDSVGFLSGKITGFFGLSSLYRSQKMYSEAVEYLRKSKKLKDALSERYRNGFLSAIYTNLSINFSSMNELDSALLYGHKTMDLKTEMKDHRGIEIAASGLGYTYLKKTDTTKSLHYFNLALESARKVGHDIGIIRSLIYQGDLLIKLKKFNSVKKILKELDTLTTNLEDPLSKKNIYNLRSQYYKGIKNYKEALKYYVLLSDANDSLKRIENSAKIIAIETAYETKQYKQAKDSAEVQQAWAEERATSNEIKKDLAEERVDKHRKTVLIIGVFAIVTLVLLWIVFRKLRVIRDQKKDLDVAYEKLEMTQENELAAHKLQVLKSQMNPHFIFNSINSIQDLVLQEKVDKSYDYLVDFADLVRSTLEYSDKDFIHIDEEIQFLKVYLNLEQLRMGTEFSYTITNEVVDKLKVPSLILQPFVENALIHGLLHKSGEKKISISFRLEEHLICTIEDNGVGRKQAGIIKNRRSKSHTSFATQAIRKRLDLLSQQFGIEALVKYTDLGTETISMGTRVDIYLPYK